MSERIKELKQQAGIDDNPDQEGLDLFAELIVKDCATVILETPVDYMETDTMHRIRDSVKQHFGVEE